jgi:hypothetical protein
MMSPSQLSSDERGKERRETYQKDGEMYLFTTGWRGEHRGRRLMNEKESSFVSEIARENMNRNGGNNGRTRREERDRIKLWCYGFFFTCLFACLVFLKILLAQKF